MSASGAIATRLVVLTDISTLTADHGEPDDTQSLVRLLLYANEFEIEGLVASHTRHRDAIHPDYIESIVGRYGEVLGNLRLHDVRYPSAEPLLSVIRGGHPDRDHVGPGRDSPGSELITQVLDRPDPRPVWFTVWGGPHEMAQALWQAERTRSPFEFAAFKRKIRVHAIADQDATGQWIKRTHPDVFYITSYHVFRGMYKDGDSALVTPDWVEANITNGHGALGGAYPNYCGGDPWGGVQGVKEGDTPSFLYLLPNGLSNPEQPTWGTWGGRFDGGKSQYEDALIPSLGAHSQRATVHRWRTAYQADFQARLDWCVAGPKEANHAPVARVAGLLRRAVAPGQVVELDASRSFDPDGDALRFQWWYYREASTFPGWPTIQNHGNPRATLVAPRTEMPLTLHVVLTVTDDGTPPLRSYQRVVITVDPEL